MRKTNKSKCIMCSLGCGLIIETENGEAVNLEYDKDDPVGRGALCSKGNFILELLNHPNRYTEPLSNGKTVTWDSALNSISEKLKNNMGKSGVGLIVNGDCSAEDISTADLFGKKFLGKNRTAIFYPTRDDMVYHALSDYGVTVRGDIPDELEKSDCIITVGDPFDVGPVIAGRVLNARYARRGGLFTAISKNGNTTSKFANVRLPGSERKNLAEMLRVAVEEPFGSSLSWAETVKNSLSYPSEQKIALTAKKFIETPSSVMILETQDPVTASLAAAFVKASGNDKQLFCLSTYGNAAYTDSSIQGMKTTEDILGDVVNGDIKTLILLGADIVKGLPGRDALSALKKAEFVVAGACFENETTAAADIVLPVSLWLESGGTYNGNTLEQIVDSYGGALSYGRILSLLSKRLGAELSPSVAEKSDGKNEISSDKIAWLLAAAEKDVSEPLVYSTSLRYGEGSLTDNVKWMKLLERNVW